MSTTQKKFQEASKNREIKDTDGPETDRKPERKNARTGSKPSSPTASNEAAAAKKATKASATKAVAAKSKSGRASKAKAPAKSRSQSKRPSRTAGNQSNAAAASNIKKKTISGARQVNQAAEKIVESSTAAAETAADMVSKSATRMMSDIVQAPVGVTQGTVTSTDDRIHQFGLFGHAGIEVALASALAVTRAAQNTHDQLADIFLRNSEEASRQIRLMAGCRTPDDAIALQAKWANSIFEASLNDLAQLSEQGFQILDEIADPLSRSLTESASESL